LAEGTQRVGGRAREPALTVVDASVWVSALVPGDAHHAVSRAWLEAEDVAERLLVAPALLLPEVAAAISRRTGRPALARRAVRSLSRLSALRLVELDADLAEHAARLAADHALRLADSVYVAVAKHLALPLATWDREQARRAARAVDVTPIRVTPGSIP